MHRHLSATVKAYEDLAPTQFWGYKIEIDVRHDEKIVDFVTESLTPNDKMEVFLRQKRMIQELYPSYIITERHN